MAEPTPYIEIIRKALLRDINNALAAEAEQFLPGRQHHNGPRRITIVIRVERARVLRDWLDSLDGFDAARMRESSRIDARFINDVRRALNTIDEGRDLRPAVTQAVAELRIARGNLPPLDGPEIVQSAARARPASEMPGDGETRRVISRTDARELALRILYEAEARRFDSAQREAREFGDGETPDGDER